MSMDCCEDINVAKTVLDKANQDYTWYISSVVLTDEDGIEYIEVIIDEAEKPSTHDFPEIYKTHKIITVPL